MKKTIVLISTLIAIITLSSCNNKKNYKKDSQVFDSIKTTSDCSDCGSCQDHEHGPDSNHTHETPDQIHNLQDKEDSVEKLQLELKKELELEQDTHDHKDHTH